MLAQAGLRSTKGYSRLTLWLIVITLASGLIYWLAFYELCHFNRVVIRSDVYQDYLYEAPPEFRWIILIAIIFLGVLYGLGWYFVRRIHGSLTWVIVLGGSLVFGSLLSYIYPLDASDLFNNIMFGRMQHVYGANPYIQVADEFKQDIFFPLISWSDTKSDYGPLWQLLARLGSYLAGNDMLSNVIVFKWLHGIFFLACFPVFIAILRQMRNSHVLANVLLFAWNPIILYEVWGNGHNDIMMVFFILLSIWANLVRKHTLAILALIAGALVKFIPLLLIPVAISIAFRELSDNKRRALFIINTLFLSTILVILAYYPYWEGFDTITFLQRALLFTTSIPAILYRILKPWLGTYLAASLINLTAAGLTLTFVIWQSWRALKDKSVDRYARSILHIFVFYLLITCTWFQQWYTVWLLFLVPVLVIDAERLFAILFGFLAISKQFFMFPLVIYADPRLPQPWYEIALTAGVLGLPWILAMALLLNKNANRLVLKIGERLHAY